jgi:hypothetical protein
VRGRNPRKIGTKSSGPCIFFTFSKPRHAPQILHSPSKSSSNSKRAYTSIVRDIDGRMLAGGAIHQRAVKTSCSETASYADNERALEIGDGSAYTDKGSTVVNVSFLASNALALKRIQRRHKPKYFHYHFLEFSFNSCVLSVISVGNPRLHG